MSLKHIIVPQLKQLQIRIAELEEALKQKGMENDGLKATIAKMRPLVEAALKWHDVDYPSDEDAALRREIRRYCDPSSVVSNRVFP